MRHIKSFFLKIKDFIGSNYWLQPVLLVAIVFTVVFSITGITDVLNSIKGWFTPNTDTCRYCESYKTTQYTEFENVINAAVDEQEPVFIVITQEGCASCSQIYPLLNKFLSDNRDFTLYNLKIIRDDEGEIEFDNTTSKTKYEALAQSLYEVALANGDSAESLQSAMFNGGAEIGFGTPTLLVYSNQGVDLNNNILRYKIGAFASNELLRLTDFLTKTTNGYFTLDY